MEGHVLTWKLNPTQPSFQLYFPYIASILVTYIWILYTHMKVMWQWKSTFLPLSNLCLFKFFFSTHIPTSLSCTAMCIHRRGHFPWRADTNPCGPSNSHFGASIVRWASYYKKCPYEAGTLSGRYSREVVFFDLLKGYLSLQLGHYCNDK